MLKKICIGVGGLLVVLIIIAFASINSIVKTAVTSVGPSVLGVSVDVRDVDISIFSGKGAVKGITIGNPEGYSQPYSIKLESASFDMDLMSLLSDKIHINYIIIEAPELVYELGPKGPNISALTRHSRDEAEKVEEQPDMVKEQGKSIQIDQLRITEGKIIPAVGIASAPIPIPSIQINDIGKDDGKEMHPAEAITLVLQKMLTTIATLDLDILKNSAEAVRGEAIDAVKGISEGLNSLFKKD